MTSLIIEIPDSPAVCDNESFVSPLLPEKSDQELVASAAWLAFISIICTHHLLDVSSLYQTLKGIKICLVQIPP